MGKNLINTKFDDIDGKIDFMIELYQELQAENRELTDKISLLEEQIDKQNDSEKRLSEQDVLVQSKIDGLLKKLDTFSNSATQADTLNK